MKFKAAILTEINRPLEIVEIYPTPLQFGQVLVKVLVSGLCGSQLQEIQGLKGAPPPHMMGHEGCGIVEEIGLGVNNVKVGDKVVIHWRTNGKGIESGFPYYILNGNKISNGKCTTLSEYSIVSENRLTPVDKDSSNELLALLGCSLSTSLGLVNKEANIKMGESVLISGLGGLGGCLVEAAKLANAYPIVGMDIHQNKEYVVENFINFNKNDIKEKLNDFGIKDVDVIIETSGSPQAISKTLPFLADSGRFIMVGQPKPGVEIPVIGSGLFGKTPKTILTSAGGSTIPEIDFPRYVKMHKAGLINIERIITHCFKLEEINLAVQELVAGNAGRIMIYP